MPLSPSLNAGLRRWTRGGLRWSAYLIAALCLAYAVQQVWTAAELSVGAPLGWRLKLFATEGGVPVVAAAGLFMLTRHRWRFRHLGWVLVIGPLVVGWVWTGYVVTP